MKDTIAFCKAIYTDDSGSSYGQNYSSDDIASYNYKVGSIYLPKAEFLCTAFRADNIDPYEMEYLDFGAGTGYFVAALDNMGLTKVSGWEVSESQVAQGNAMIGREVMHVHDLEQTNDLLRNTKADVVSMIGVLEHLQDPRAALREIQSNDYIKYFYISVPTFSLSTFIEFDSPDVFHRQLGSGHTHLYTDDSLRHLADEFGMSRLAEWWFGGDAVDLYRHLRVNLDQKTTSARFKEKLSEYMIPFIDSVQLEMDKMKGSSEVHMLFKT
jgi:Methyltransferase domain